jgi:hypothetical protein
MMAAEKRRRDSVQYIRNIQGRQVPLVLLEVDPEDVKLDPENPRLRFSLQQLPKKQRTDDACTLLLTSQEETEVLKRSIVRSGGVQEPIYVRANGLVAEGNRRVVAMRSLKEEYPKNALFASMPAWRIPANTPESVVQDLLNEIHLGSVRGWAPYEKGAQMRALVHDGGLIEEEVAERYRMTAREVRQFITAVDFMEELYFPITDDPTDPGHRSKFSYFLEFVKSTRLAKHTVEDRGLKKRFARWVKDEKIDAGAQVRRLARILDSAEATRLLDVVGYDAAVERIKREDPQEQELYAVIELARRRVEAMTVEELVELQKSEDRQRILTELRDEIDEKLEMLARIADE